MASFAHTYVLKCTDGEWYIGSTDDLRRRLRQHQKGWGGLTTAGQSPELVDYEACRSLAEARKREKQLKTGFGRDDLRRRLAFERFPPGD